MASKPHLELMMAYVRSLIESKPNLGFMMTSKVNMRSLMKPKPHLGSMMTSKV